MFIIMVKITVCLRLKNKVMKIRVDLTFELESLPEYITPKVTAAPMKTKEYAVPHPKRRTPQKA